MKNIIISSLNNMTTEKELDEGVIETLQQMVKDKVSIKEIANYLEANIDLSISSVAVMEELNIVEVLQSLDQIFPNH
jgi:hypothetical protein